jgi:hypothetical protein
MNTTTKLKREVKPFGTRFVEFIFTSAAATPGVMRLCRRTSGWRGGRNGSRAGGNKHQQKIKKPMKSIIALVAITILAAVAFVGCSQNSSTSTPSTPSGTNSMPADTNTPAH